MILAENILKKAYQKAMTPRFESSRTPRVSLIGMCDRLHVYLVLNPGKSTIDPFYWRAGYALQERVFTLFKQEYLLSVQEVEVPTYTKEANCHPDIYIPELKHAIQVKTDSDSAAKQRKTHKAHKDQALLEWHFWRKWGYCIADPDSTFPYMINEVPKSYEVFYIARESYGEHFFSVPIHYVTSEARALEEKLLNLVEYCELEVLPEPPAKKCKDCWQCPLKCFESEEI